MECFVHRRNLLWLCTQISPTDNRLSAFCRYRFSNSITGERKVLTNNWVLLLLYHQTEHRQIYSRFVWPREVAYDQDLMPLIRPPVLVIMIDENTTSKKFLRSASLIFFISFTSAKSFNLYLWQEPLIKKAFCISLKKMFKLCFRGFENPPMLSLHQK
jgi:hypothetical protein